MTYTTEENRLAWFIAGQEYAKWLWQEAAAVTSVDIAAQITKSQSLPDSDYTALIKRGYIPNPRAYWQGFNDIAKQMQSEEDQP